MSPPAGFTTVAALMDWLASRSAGHAPRLPGSRGVRAAVNQDFAEPGDAVKPGDEVAFFPPVTGG